MLIQIQMAAGIHEVATEGGWRANGPAIPCHRCGVCCERWQPLLTPGDTARLAAHLGMPITSFQAEYTTAYPFSADERLLRRAGSGCVFLRYEPDTAGADGIRRAACAVHPMRPGVCRDWMAGFDKKECVQGLERFTAGGQLIQIADLYPEPRDREDFTRASMTAAAGGRPHAGRGVETLPLPSAARRATGQPRDRQGPAGEPAP